MMRRLFVFKETFVKIAINHLLFLQKSAFKIFDFKNKTTKTKFVFVVLCLFIWDALFFCWSFLAPSLFYVPTKGAYCSTFLILQAF